jgi:hypothetical protein
MLEKIKDLTEKVKTSGKYKTSGNQCQQIWEIKHLVDYVFFPDGIIITYHILTYKCFIRSYDLLDWYTNFKFLPTHNNTHRKNYIKSLNLVHGGGLGGETNGI